MSEWDALPDAEPITLNQAPEPPVNSPVAPTVNEFAALPDAVDIRTKSVLLGPEHEFDRGDLASFIRGNIRTVKDEYRKGKEKDISLFNYGLEEEEAGGVFYESLSDEEKSRMPESILSQRSILGEHFDRRMAGESSIQEDILMDTALVAIISGGVGLVAAPAVAASSSVVTSVLRAGYLFFSRATAAAVADLPVNVYSNILFREGHTKSGVLVGVVGGITAALTIERALAKTLDGSLRKAAPDFWAQQVAAPDIAADFSVTRLQALAKAADEGDMDAAQEITEALVKVRRLAEQAESAKAPVDKIDDAVPTKVKVKAPARESVEREEVKKISKKQLMEEAKAARSTLDEEALKTVDSIVERLAIQATEKEFVAVEKLLIKKQVLLDHDADPARQVVKRLTDEGGITKDTLRSLGVPEEQIKAIHKKFRKLFTTKAASAAKKAQIKNIVSTAKEMDYGDDIGRMFGVLHHAPSNVDMVTYAKAVMKDELDELYEGLLDIKRTDLMHNLYGSQKTMAGLTHSRKFTRIATKDEIAASASAEKVALKVYRQAEKEAKLALEAQEANLKALAKQALIEKRAKWVATAKRRGAKLRAIRAERHLQKKMRENMWRSKARIKSAIGAKNTSYEWSEQLAVVMQRWFAKESAKVIEGKPALALEEFLTAQLRYEPMGNATAEFMKGKSYTEFMDLRKVGIPVEDLSADQWKIIENFSKDFNVLSVRENTILSFAKKFRLNRIVDEATENANQNISKLARLETKAIEDQKLVEKIIHTNLEWLSGLKRMRFLLEDLDNFQQGGGILTRTIMEPAEKAVQDMILKTRKYEPQIREIFETVAGKERTSTYFAKPVTLKVGDEGLELNWTREQLFSAGLHTGNTKNQAVLVNTMRSHLDRAGVNIYQNALEEIDPTDLAAVKAARKEVNEQFATDALEAVAETLTRTEKAAISKFWKMTKELGKELDVVHRTLTGKTMAREANYFPIAWKQNRMAGLPTESVDFLKGTKFHVIWQEAGGAGIRIARQGVGAVKELDLSLGVVSRHMNDAMMQITHAVPLSNIGKLVNNRRFREMVVSTRGEAVYAQFPLWMKNMTRTSRDTANPTLLALRRGVSVAILGVTNVGVMLKQPLSMISAASDIGGDNAVKGVKYLSKAHLEFFRDPKALIEGIHRVSPEMAERFNSMSREISEMVRAYSPTGSRRSAQLAKFQSLMMSGVRMFDTIGASVTWKATFDRVMIETGDAVSAAKEAMRVVARTQPSGTSLELPSHLMSKNEWFRSITMFMGYFDVLHNMTSEVMRRMPPLRGPLASHQLTKSQVFSSLFMMVTAPAIVSHIVTKGELPDVQDVAKGTASLAVGGIPVVRDISAAVMSGYQYSPSPMADAVKKVASTVINLSEITGEDADYDKLVKDAAILSGYLVGAPVSSMFKRVEGIVEFMDQEGSLHDAMLGKNKEE